jgi:hypothetical protein
VRLVGREAARGIERSSFVVVREHPDVARSVLPHPALHLRHERASDPGTTMLLPDADLVGQQLVHVACRRSRQQRR